MAREAPALTVEKRRLAAIGGRFLGIIGDRNHRYGYHLAAADLPSGDYSRKGANQPIADWSSACAIDIGMNWRASRAWLRWLIREIRDDRIKGIAEVIGSYDGRNVRYWSDGSGWGETGVKYTGSGHDTWTHVAIYRSDTTTDRGLLQGWTATGKDDDMPNTDQVVDDLLSRRIPPNEWPQERWGMREDGYTVGSYVLGGYTTSRAAMENSRDALAEVLALRGQVSGLTNLVKQLLAAPPADLTDGQFTALLESVTEAAERPGRELLDRWAAAGDALDGEGD